MAGYLNLRPNLDTRPPRFILAWRRRHHTGVVFHEVEDHFLPGNQPLLLDNVTLVDEDVPRNAVADEEAEALLGVVGLDRASNINFLHHDFLLVAVVAAARAARRRRLIAE